MDILPEISCSLISRYLLSVIPNDERYKLQKMDVDCDFIGFVDIYYALSQIIPKDYIIIDFGCGYNAQSYLFKDFNKFISVTPDLETGEEIFNGYDNCEIYKTTTGEFIKDYPEYTKKENVFAICNFVPAWFGEDSSELVRNNFKNVYTFYPKTSEELII